MKSEATYTANLQKNLSDCQQNWATQEDKLKERKSKLWNWSKSYNKTLEKLDWEAGCRALGIIDKLVTGPYWWKW